MNGSSAAKANAAHTHAATDIVSGTLDNVHTSGTANATASTLVLRDGSGSTSFMGHADPRMTAKYAHMVDMAKKNPALFIPAKVG